MNQKERNYIRKLLEDGDHIGTQYIERLLDHCDEMAVWFLKRASMWDKEETDKITDPECEEVYKTFRKLYRKLAGEEE